MSKPSLVIVIAEDERHQMLIRRYLKKHHIGPHQSRYVPTPAGRGSAEQWVRTCFAKEVSAYRNRQAKAQTALIVIIDADSRSVQNRLAQLDAALDESGGQRLKADEQVARLVPKRNVETWILCLNNHEVDEEADYKTSNHDWRELISGAAETLFLWARPHESAPDRCTPSLRSGLTELHNVRFPNAR